jgi:hypothetical protein
LVLQIIADEVEKGFEVGIAGMPSWNEFAEPVAAGVKH